MLEPADGAVDALLEVSAWFETGGGGECGGVSVGLIYVAGLHRKVFLFCLSSDGFLDAVDIVHEPRGMLIADVVDPVRRGGCGRIGSYLPVESLSSPNAAKIFCESDFILL